MVVVLSSVVRLQSRYIESNWNGQGRRSAPKGTLYHSNSIRSTRKQTNAEDKKPMSEGEKVSAGFQRIAILWWVKGDALTGSDSVRSNDGKLPLFPSEKRTDIHRVSISALFSFFKNKKSRFLKNKKERSN